MKIKTLLLATLLLGSSAFGAEKSRLAVTQFKSSANTQSLASALNGVVANELQRLGVFLVTTDDQVKSLISLERQKQLLGSGDEGAGISQLGTLLAVEYVITGEVNKLQSSKGDVLSLQLVLLHTNDGKRVASELVNAKSEGELVNQVGPATVKLCSKVLSGKQGTLYVAVAEAGASVKVDDSIRGTTPMAGRLELAAGPHLITVEKEGFVTWQREVRITPSEHHEEQVSMVPSPDFIQRYEASASRMRIGAYATTGLAVAGFAAAGYFQYQNAQLFGAENKEGTFKFHQARVLEGYEDDRAPAQALKARIEQGTTLTYISAGVGAASAIGAAAFFLWGDQPGRYKRYEVVSMGIAPTNGGAAAALALQW